MKKDDAKIILSSIYDEILTHLDRNEEEVEDILLINFLHNVAHALIKSDIRKSFDFYSQQLTFEDEYKLLAEQSLHSYSDSNEKFSELSKEQEEELKRLHESRIDINALTDRFSSIQSDLHSEVDRANTTISELVKRVKELAILIGREPYQSDPYKEMSQEFYDIWFDQLHMVGTVGLVPLILIAKTDLGNVPPAFQPGGRYPFDLNWFAQGLFWKWICPSILQRRLSCPL